MENNIGVLNAIFIQNTDSILKRKNGKRIIKEYIDIISKNKLLLKEYLVYDYIDNVKNTKYIKETIQESLNYLNGIDLAELKKLNNKLSTFMSENKIFKINDIKNEDIYNSIDYLIFSEKSLKNINERVDKLNIIADKINENVLVSKETEEDNIEMITEDIDMLIKLTVNNFNKKYGELLSEEEKNIFKEITSITDDTEKELFFESKRKECLSLTNALLKEDNEPETKEMLLNVKEKLLEDKYNSDSYMEDIISLFDLKQILS